tara:strand:- start:2896 stop:3228 length:333 start_codon:yes stop_codon:yes gene_type:complete
MGRIKYKKKKPTGEWDMFMEIWAERKHICANCGKKLESPLPIHFSHILTKGRTPELRLNKDNIELLCAEDHMKWETADLETKRNFTWDDTKLRIVKENNYLLYCKLFGDE